MIRKIAALMVVAFATLLVPFMSPAHAYGPKLPTNLGVTIVVIKHGQPIQVRFVVSASDGTSPAGTVSYTLARVGAAARPVAARGTGSVHVNGSPVTVSDVNARYGKYAVTAHFTPSDTSTYLGSNGSDRASIKGNRGEHHHHGGGGGGLPNTGGPDLGWLIAGVVLAGAGAGTVAYARRRTPAAA